jgi:dienelactone hydrolase
MTASIQSQETFRCADAAEAVEAFGRSAAMIRVADEIVTEAYAALLPDLFERGSWFSRVRQAMKDLKAGSGQGVQDLIDARNWHANRDYVDSGKIVVMRRCVAAALRCCSGKRGCAG